MEKWPYAELVNIAMTHQSEAQLERNLIEKLARYGFAPIAIEDADDLIVNLRRQ